MYVTEMKNHSMLKKMETTDEIIHLFDLKKTRKIINFSQRQNNLITYR